MVERSVLHTAASLLGLALVASASLAVVAVAAASSAARPQAPETPVSRTAAEDVGVGSARALQLGINVDPSNPAGNPSPSGIAALGATWVRIEYKDSAPAGSPPSALPTYTTLVQQFASAGISTLLIVDYSSLPGRPAPTDPSTAWLAYSSAFAQRAAAVVAAVSPAAVEVWNEPDLTSVGNVPAEHYGPLLNATYSAVKASSPDVSVVLGGLATGNPNYVADVRAAAGGRLPADGVGVHPYGQRPSPDWPNPAWGFGVLTDLLSRYYSVEPKPLWITEVGTTDGNARPTFPQHAFAAVAANLTAAQCEHVLWFCWSDGMVNGFGVVDASGNPKPSYNSYQAYAHSQP